MFGIRLHHTLYKSCNFVVELADRPFAAPKGCPTCSRPDKVVEHAAKSIHFKLDENGDVVVGPGVFASLKSFPGLAGFEVANEVSNPPAQKVGAVETPTQRIVSAQEEFYVPGKNKYEASKDTEKVFHDLLIGINDRLDRLETAKRAEKRTIVKLDGGKNG